MKRTGTLMMTRLIACALALGVALPESDDYDTVGGFVMTTLGRIPAVGESFQFEKLHITIIEAEPTRVGRVRIELKEPEQAVAAK